MAWDKGTVRAPLEPYVALSVPPPLFVLREETLTKVSNGDEDGDGDGGGDGGRGGKGWGPGL